MLPKCNKGLYLLTFHNEIHVIFKIALKYPTSWLSPLLLRDTSQSSTRKLEMDIYSASIIALPGFEAEAWKTIPITENNNKWKKAKLCMFPSVCLEQTMT